MRSLFAVWWVERLPTFIADSGQAIVRLANFLDKKTLAALREEHTPSGAHRVRTIRFPRWVPPEVRQAAENISEEEAHLQLGDWIRLYATEKDGMLK